MKEAGQGAANKRRERRNAKYNAPVGPGSHKPIGGPEKPDPKDATPDKNKGKAPGKMSKKRKAEESEKRGSRGGGSDGDGEFMKGSKFAKKPEPSGGAGGGEKKAPYDKKKGTMKGVMKKSYDKKGDGEKAGRRPLFIPTASRHSGVILKRSETTRQSVKDSKLLIVVSHHWSEYQAVKVLIDTTK